MIWITFRARKIISDNVVAFALLLRLSLLALLLSVRKRRFLLVFLGLPGLRLATCCLGGTGLRQQKIKGKGTAFLVGGGTVLSFAVLMLRWIVPSSVSSGMPTRAASPLAWIAV